MVCKDIERYRKREGLNYGDIAILYRTNSQSRSFEEQLRRGKLADRFRTVLYSFYKLTPQEIKDSYLLQHGNLKNFEENKADFAAQLMDTKMSTAQLAFMDDFNHKVKVLRAEWDKLHAVGLWDYES